MIEDDSYRCSSQYRLWSFTPLQLDDHRREANKIGTQKLHKPIGNESATNGRETADIDGFDSDSLTVDEEQILLQHAIRTLLDLRNHLDPRPSSTVAATAIQYLRRFYLYNSLMIYPAQQMMLVALFTAYKTEHVRIALARFLAQIKHSGLLAGIFPLDEDDIRSLEYLLVQALRFTFDVRHPMRALDGGVAEILLRARDLDCFTSLNMDAIERRINTTADKAKALLMADTQMTDAYFLYTPPQIYLAALYLVDKDMVTEYVSHTFSRLGTHAGPIRQKILDTITACSELIASYQTAKQANERQGEHTRLENKLKNLHGRAQGDVGAVARNRQAAKRAEQGKGVQSESDEDKREKKIKKRKLEAGKTVDSDGGVFGPEIKALKP